MKTSSITLTVHFQHEEDAYDLFADDIIEAIKNAGDPYAAESFTVTKVEEK